MLMKFIIETLFNWLKCNVFLALITSMTHSQGREYKEGEHISDQGFSKIDTDP